MTSFDMVLSGWSAWGPGLPTPSDWSDWLPNGGGVDAVESKPPCKHIPAMVRRRLSLASRMFLTAADDACRRADREPSQLHLIYAGTNGEIGVLSKLLASLYEESPLSPTAFSNSVHHVPSGHYGMLYKHKTVTRTVSSMRDPFTTAFVEAACLLKRLPDLPVLLVFAEEIPPVPFTHMLAVPPFPYATALVLSAPGADGIPLQFIPGLADGTADKPVHDEDVFEFLRWLGSDRDVLNLSASFGVCQWKK